MRELKAQGKSSDEEAQLLSAEFRVQYPDWDNPIGSQILSADFTQNSADCLREGLCYATIPCEYRSRKPQRLQRISKSVRAELSHSSGKAGPLSL